MMFFGRTQRALVVLVASVVLLCSTCGGGRTVSCAESSSGLCVCDSEPIPEGWQPRATCNHYPCRFRVPDTDRCFSLAVQSTDPNVAPGGCPLADNPPSSSSPSATGAAPSAFDLKDERTLTCP